MLLWYDDITQNVTLSHLVTPCVMSRDHHHSWQYTKNVPVVCTKFYEMYGLCLFSIMSSVNDNKLWPIKMDQWSSVNIWHGHEVGYLFSVMLRLQLTKTIISRGQHMHHARSYQLNCTKFSLYQNASCHLTLIPYPGAIFVRTILFSSLRVEKSVRKFWENLTFIFSIF